MSRTQPTPQTSHVLWLVLTAAVMGSASLAYPMTLLDSPLSTAGASTILEGGALYRDIWDARAPGVFFAFALQLALFGKSAVALRVFDVLWQLATALLLYAIGARVYHRKEVGAIAGISYLVAYFCYNYWNWAQPDTFLTLPLALALLLLLRGLERQSVAAFGGVGLCVGLATLFKVPYGLFGILPLVTIVLAQRREVRRLLGSLTSLAIGFGTPIALCVLYFWAKGALDDFLDTQLVFAPAYVAQVHHVFGLRRFLFGATRPALVPLHAMALLGLGMLVARGRRGSGPRLGEMLLVGWIAVVLSVVVMHGSYLGYHYVALFAPVTLLFASALHTAVTAPRSRYGWPLLPALGLVGLALSVSAATFSGHVALTRRILSGHVLDAEWRDLGHYIKARTSPSETILVWGNTPIVYLYAERRAASRFMATAYLSVEAPRLRYRELFLAEVEKNQPVYLAVFREASVTPALPDARTSFAQFRALQDLIAARYTLERETPLYQLYRRKS